MRIAGRRSEQEDLGIEELQSPLELFLAPHLDRAVETQVERLVMPLLLADLLAFLVTQDEGDCVGHLCRLLEARFGPPEDRERRGLPHRRRVAGDDEGLCALRLGGSRGFRVLDGGDHGDAVALGDRMAEAARAGHSS